MHSKPIRIAIIDEEWMWAEALESIISKTDDLALCGYANNAEAGILISMEQKPDVVIVDVRLKGEHDGIWAIERILKDSPKTKVMVFTADGQEEWLFAAIKADASGYLLKREVDSPGILLAAIRAVVSDEAYITPAVAKRILAMLARYSCGDTSRISTREKEILLLVEEGKSNNEIADALFIHERTVANHLNNIFTKLDVKNRSGAVNKARREGLLL